MIPIPPPPPPLPSSFSSNFSNNQINELEKDKMSVGIIPQPPPLPPPPPPLPSFSSNPSTMQFNNLVKDQIQNNLIPPPPPPPPLPPFSSNSSNTQLNNLVRDPLSNSSMPPPPPPPPPPFSLNLNNQTSNLHSSTNSNLSDFNNQIRKFTDIRKTYNPNINMKSLHWSKINVNQLLNEETELIWEYTNDLDLKFDELEKHFSQPKHQPPKIENKKNEEKQKINTTIDILDRNRAHNLNILIKSCRIDTTNLANAVYNFDSSVYNYENIKKIKEMLATSDENEAIIDYVKNNPKVILGKAEKFLYDLSQVHCFDERINCFLFALSFDEQIQVIENNLNNFKVVCRFLLQSQPLRNVISIILSLGNYMNSNTPRGQSAAIDISILPKLKDTKSTIDNSLNLLYYVVKIYVDQNFNKEDILKNKDLTTKLPVPEPQDLERASSASFNDINKDLKSIDCLIKSVENQYNKVISSCLNNENPDNLHIEPFQSKMKNMLEHSKKVYKEQEESLEECKKMFLKTIKFFSFQPKSSNLAEQQKEFFLIWQNFCTYFKDYFRKEINAKIKEILDDAKSNASKIMNKNNKSISTEKKALEPNSLKARIIRKFKR